MTPMFFHGHNFAFQPPKEWDPSKGECLPLPVQIDAEGLTSVWKPSESELAALNAGGGLSIFLGTHVQPVMSVGVVSADALIVSA